MTIYDHKQWLEKCENEVLEQNLLMPASDEFDRIRRSIALDNTQYYFKNKLFLQGIYEEIENGANEN